MIDTHCHLNDLQFEKDVDLVVSNFLSSGVECAICVGCDPLGNEKAVEIAKNYDCVFCAVGIHPDDCDKYDEQKLVELLSDKVNKIVALGEIGLDYFHNKDNKELQKQVFISQIELAKKFNLPIVVHCRDAYFDTYEILKGHADFNLGVVLHCYSGSWDIAKKMLKLGCKFSFTGVVTYKNARNVQEVARNLPVDTFFFETDSPYLSPANHRGERNEPKNVIETAQFVADLRGISYQELEKITDKTAKSFFRLP